MANHIEEQIVHLQGEMLYAMSGSDLRAEDGPAIRQIMLASQMIEDSHWRLSMLHSGMQMISMSKKLRHLEYQEAWRASSRAVFKANY